MTHLLWSHGDHLHPSEVIMAKCLVMADTRHQTHIFEEKVQIHDVAQMQKKTVITEPRDLYTPWDIYYLCIE